MSSKDTSIDDASKAKETFAANGIRQLPSTTIYLLLRGSVPEQTEYGTEKDKTAYDLFSHEPWTVFVKDEDQIIATPGPISRTRFLQLLHFAAPSKVFGIDVRDKQDWVDLFDTPVNSPEHARRLAAHRNIPGFAEFEACREQLLQLVSLGNARRGERFFVLPVIHLVKDPQNPNTYLWNFDKLPDDVIHTLLATTSVLEGDPTRLMPVVGPLVIAAYSPEVTRTWAGSDGRRNYQRPVDDFPQGSQDMGSTQVFPLTVGLASDLFSGKLLQALLAHAASQTP